MREAYDVSYERYQEVNYGWAFIQHHPSKGTIHAVAYIDDQDRVVWTHKNEYRDPVSGTWARMSEAQEREFYPKT